MKLRLTYLILASCFALLLSHKSHANSTLKPANQAKEEAKNIIRLSKENPTTSSGHPGQGSSKDKTSQISLANSDQQPLNVLELTDVFNLIDAFHPSLKSSELNMQNARAELMSAWSTFIPSYKQRGVLADYLDSKYKRQQELSSINEITWQSPFAIELVGGLRVSSQSLLPSDTLEYPGSKAYLTNIKRTRLSGFTDGEVFLGLRMPLLRGLLIDSHRATLKKAKLENPLAEISIRIKRAELFLKGAEKYWDWVATGLQYEVAENLLEIAKVRTTGIEDRVKEGANPPIDAVEAQSQVNSREENLAKARRNFEKESIALSIYLWESDLSYMTPNKQHLPRYIPEPISIPESIIDEHLALSLNDRPELRRIELNQKQEQINLRLARNEMLPKLDFEVLPIQDLNRLDGGSNIIGSIHLDLPAYPLKAKSQVLKTKTKIEKNKLELNLTQAQIKNEVRDALSFLETSRERANRAREAFEKLKQVAEGEQLRFKYGGSNLFLLNQREAAAAESENKLIEALADHQKALARYRYAIGEWSIPDFDDSWLLRLAQSNKP